MAAVKESASKQDKRRSDGKFAKGRAGGPGRKPGVPNKATAELRDMWLGALEDAGGRAYLARQAEDNPTAFMAGLGKFIPRDMKLDVDVTHRLESIVAAARARGLESRN